MALAGLLRRQDAYEEARPLFERSLRIWETSLGANHPHTAMGLNNLGWLLRAQGAYEEARPLLERALRVFETSLGPEHPDTVFSAKNLAVLELDLGETEQALVRSRATSSAVAAHLHRVMWSLSESERLRFVRAREWHLELLLSITRETADDTSARTPHRLGSQTLEASSFVRPPRFLGGLSSCRGGAERRVGAACARSVGRRGRR